MSEIDESSEWYHVVAQFMEDRLRELGCALPGNVVSYDRASQTAQVKFAVTERVPAYTGDEIVYEDRPDLFNVPVIWPGGGQVGVGSSFFHPGLEPGAGVLLVCADSDFAQWRRTGKKMNQRNDVYHSWKNAVAIPGLNPRPDKLPASNVVLAAGGVLSSVAIAGPLLTILSGLAGLIATASAGTPVDPVTKGELALVGTSLGTLISSNVFASQYIKTGDV